MPSYTERGLRVLVLALAVALANGVLGLAFLLGVLSGLWIPRTLDLLENVVGVLVVGLGLLGFWTLRRGRDEHGAAHVASLRRATMAMVLAAGSEMLLLGTGLALGFGLLPSVVVTGGTYPPVVTAEWVLQTTHFAAYLLIAGSVGLFLLWTVWGLLARLPRWIALAALVLGLPTPAITLVTVSALADLGSLPAAVFYAAWVFPAVSISLWLLAYLLTMVQIRDVVLHATPGPAPNEV